jgi:hypothetical protein
MLRRTLRALGLSMAVAVVPALATAQQSCQQVLPSDFRRIITSAGHEMMYFRDPVRMICTGGVQIEADSAAMNRTTSSLEMVGRVLYRDGERQLTSDWAHYLGQTDELYARDNVVLTDMAEGSVIRGDDFHYRRETPDRPVARMVMTGTRPEAELRRGGAPGGEAAQPVRVWGRRLELLGETVFLAENDVEIERVDLRGSGQFLRFDQESEHMLLTGAARVETDDYQLEGERINAYLADDEVREVLSDGNARLVAEDLTVAGRTIRIGFEDGDPTRVEAWSPPTTPQAGVGEGEAAPARALAVSRDFRLLADSIDARSADGRLREVRAIGRAYGERDEGQAFGALPDAIARDWIQGDTITGYFTDPPPTEPETEAEEEEEDGDPVLERIEVIGGESHALSLYRTEASGGDGSPAVNFMRASRITLFMTDGEVSRVEADGPIEGLHLDPEQARNRPGNDAQRTTAGRPG